MSNGRVVPVRGTTRPFDIQGLWSWLFPFPAPDLGGGVDDQGELVPLLLLGEVVALLGRGEAALGRQAELVEVGVLGGLVDAALDEVLGLELAALAGDDAEHDPLALGQVAERLEAAPALVVPLAEETGHVEGVEQRGGDEVGAAPR